MEKDALYWILSTLPQVSAALVAFIGFLGLNSLEEPLRRRAEIEQAVETMLKNWQHVQVFYSEAMRTIAAGLPHSFSEAEIMREVNAWVKQNKGQIREFDAVSAKWSAVNLRLVVTRAVLAIFILFHLAIIGVSLYLLPQSAALVKLPWLQNILTYTVVSMCITTAVMIAVSFWPHSEARQKRKRRSA